MKTLVAYTSLILTSLILVTLFPGCAGKQIVSTSQTIEEHNVTIDYSPRNSSTENLLESVRVEVSARTEMLDPVNGDVLGYLNTSEVGEMVPMGSVAPTLVKLLDYTSDCYGAYDPTLQILWDVYDFDMGGRNVSGAELADALRWVDFRQLEVAGDDILRKGENIRLGFGPAIEGAIVDWYFELLDTESIESLQVQAGQCLRFRGEVPEEDRTYEIMYPITVTDDGETQRSMGFIRLEEGDCLAAIDDGYGYFFKGGEIYHMVLNPVTGLPVRNARLVVVVTEDSCLQASVSAYAAMVMGRERGLEFLDEKEGVGGLIMGEDGELSVSGGLGERFWR